VDVALELALHTFLVEEAVIDDGRATGSFSEVLFSTMKVSPSLFEILMLAGDVFCNSECDIHREVITVGELLASGTGDNSLLSRGRYKDTVELQICFCQMAKMGVISALLEPGRGGGKVVSCGVTGNWHAAVVGVDVVAEGASYFTM